MKTKVKRYPDELKMKVVQEYLSTDLSQKELIKKYGIQERRTLWRWMRKFDVQTPSQHQIELQRRMAKEKEKGKTPHERELEAKVRKLEEQLENEKLRTLALSTMIDLAEKEFKIPIRKKSGARRSKP